MRIGLSLLLVVLLNAAAVTADAIRYDQIPADASSYMHVDMDRLATSFMGKPPWATQDFAAMGEAAMGIRVSSITFYTLGESKLVGLLHGDDKVRQRWEGKAASEKGAILFSYDNQTVYYLTANPWVSDSIAAAVGASRRPPHPQTKWPATEPSPQVNIGFAAGEPGEIKLLMNGPLYIAFVGEDFVVATTDLPSMAHALDVVRSKKPSLATQDPKGIKADAPPGVISEGAGLTADFDADNLDPQAKQSPATAGNGFGHNLFGSFKGKTKLARFDMGQDDHDIYVNATVRMIDSQSAEQLKNLIMGVKALICLSVADQKPLIDPLEIQTVGKDVALHWKWSTANLSEFYRLSQTQSDHAKVLPAADTDERNPSSLPQPAH